jgi:hypothetical protein
MSVDPFDRVAPGREDEIVAVEQKSDLRDMGPPVGAHGGDGGGPRIGEEEGAGLVGGHRLHAILLSVANGFRFGNLKSAGATMLARMVVADVARLAAQQLWPRFDATRAPLAIFDGRTTRLFAFPGRPAGFAAEGDGSLSQPGLHPAVRANSTSLLNDVPIATLMIARNDRRSSMELAALAIHEAFHLFQRERYPTWSANEADLFSFPLDDPAFHALAHLETLALGRALRRPDDAARRIGVAIDERAMRFAAMPPAAVAYERATELVEGLAHYVEHGALGRGNGINGRLSAPGPSGIRRRCYETGAAIAFLLDRCRPDWKEDLDAFRDIALDRLLAKAMPQSAVAQRGFSPSERANTLARVKRELAKANDARHRMRDAWLDRAAWRLIVEATPEAPLQPRGFDPMNIQILGNGELLHKRYLVVGNDAGEIETLGRTALTEAAGEHLLFDGVLRVVIAGSSQRPVARRMDEGLVVDGPGVRGSFRAGRIDDLGPTVIIRLRTD